MWRFLKIVALFLSISPARGFPVLASMYGDSGVSAGGAVLDRYPITPWIPGAHRRARLYPVAVYTDRVRKWKYSVIVLKNPKSKKKVYGHIVDECSKTSSSCRKNMKRARQMGRTLVDIHKSAWRALGLKRFGLHPLKAGYVNTISRKNGAMRPVLSNDGKKGYVAKGWK
jgi:hypothetical protein